MLTIVTKSKGSKMVQKKGCVFRIRLPFKRSDLEPECADQSKAEDMVVDIWGDMIIQKGSERTKAKFKERGTLQLY